METRKASALLAAALLLTSCGTQIKKLEDSRHRSDDSSSSSAVVTEAKKAEPTGDEKPEVKTFTETKIIPSPSAYTEFSQTVEAEDGTLGGKATVLEVRDGYSGKGYVSDITKSEDWSVSFEIPDDQYYNISLRTASPKPCVNGLLVNCERVMTLTSDGTDEYETMTLNNRWLNAGTITVSIDAEDGTLDIDSVTIAASADVANISHVLKEPALRNENADEAAKSLYAFLCGCYGKKVILGQHDTIGSTAETDLIYKTTGKYPAIRFGDLMLATDKDSVLGASEIEAAKKWHEDGGIVAYMWHWNAPSAKKSSYYADETDFDIMKAKTDEKTAELPIEDIEKLRDAGKINDETVALIKDIDTVAETLKIFRDEGIPVIWRPLHEASNGKFWWGKDRDSYVWLWRLMFKRMNGYHKLNNLIWVWSAQNADWYVGDSQCDIISADIYDDIKQSGQVSVMLFLQSISRTKPIAMSECGSFPDIQCIADEQAYWCYIGHWGGNYLLDQDMELSEEYNTKDELIMMYNNNITVTRDKLPDLKPKPAPKPDDSSSAAEDDSSVKE